MQDYRRLIVRQKAHQLTLDIYRSTNGYPSDERFGLVSQSRRTAISIPSNLAETSGRPYKREFARFVGYAIGSAREVEYQLMLARDLGCLEPIEHSNLRAVIVEIRKMLGTLLTRPRD